MIIYVRICTYTHTLILQVATCKIWLPFGKALQACAVETCEGVVISIAITTTTSISIIIIIIIVFACVFSLGLFIFLASLSPSFPISTGPSPIRPIPFQASDISGVLGRQIVRLIRIIEIFKKFDKNNDGVISKQAGAG